MWLNKMEGIDRYSGVHYYYILGEDRSSEIECIASKKIPTEDLLTIPPLQLLARVLDDLFNMGGSNVEIDRELAPWLH